MGGQGGGVVEVAVVRYLGYDCVGSGGEEEGVDFQAEFEGEIEKAEELLWS